MLLSLVRRQEFALTVNCYSWSLVVVRYALPNEPRLPWEALVDPPWKTGLAGGTRLAATHVSAIFLPGC